MTLPHRERHLSLDEESSLLSRRTVLRRSALGLTGIGFATLLSACGDDDEEEEEEPLDADEAPDVSEPEDDPLSSDPLVNQETQIEDNTDIVETEVAGEEDEDEDEED